MTVGAVIENFGGFSTHVLLGSENLNNPRNAIMLAPISRKHFDRLDVWLIPFKVNLVLGLCALGLPQSLDFRIVETLSSTSTSSIALLTIGVLTSPLL